MTLDQAASRKRVEEAREAARSANHPTPTRGSVAELLVALADDLTAALDALEPTDETALEMGHAICTAIWDSYAWEECDQERRLEYASAARAALLVLSGGGK